MGENKNLTAIREALLKKRADHVAEQESFIKMAADAHECEEQANEVATAAYEMADVKTYHKAMDEARHNKDAEMMYQKKAEEIRKAPVISKEEYEMYISEITGCIDNTVAKNTTDFIEILKSLKSIENELDSYICEGNELLSLVQKELYKDPCGTYTSSGNFVPFSNKEKKYKDLRLLIAIREIFSNNYVDELIKAYDI